MPRGTTTSSKALCIRPKTLPESMVGQLKASKGCWRLCHEVSKLFPGRGLDLKLRLTHAIRFSIISSFVIGSDGR